MENADGMSFSQKCVKFEMNLKTPHSLDTRYTRRNLGIKYHNQRDDTKFCMITCDCFRLVKLNSKINMIFIIKPLNPLNWS